MFWKKDQPLVRVELKVDWKEIGKDIIPVLTWQTPSISDRAFRYDVPAGGFVRRGINNDVPRLRYGMALWRQLRNPSFPTQIRLSRTEGSPEPAFDPAAP